MTMITPSYLGETIEYSSLHACRSTLEDPTETVRNYRDRIRQCEALGEFAMGEQIRKILAQEQDHQIDLATALGIEVPDMSKKSGKG